MGADLELVRTRELPADIGTLLESSRREGFDFVERLVRFWEDGSNRFDRPGEVLFQVRKAGRLVAVGGLNVDPYLDEPSVGRIRHVYVLPASRRSGVGAILISRLLEHGHGRFERIRLRVGTPEGAPFYEGLGFHPSDEPGATHEYRFGQDRDRARTEAR